MKIRVLTSKVLHNYNVAILSKNATEVVNFFKYVRNLAFSEQNVWFFEKKNLVFFKIGKGSKFAVECVLNEIISWKHLVYLNYKFFVSKS